jgi:2'-5' RNA ligase
MMGGPAGELHHLWLIPEGRAEQRLDDLVRSIAARLDAVAFPAHVTLLGGLRGPSPDLSAKTERLAGLLTPFEVRITAVEHRAQFFRSLFLRIGLDEALAGAHRRALETFGSTQPPGAYMPHLSILYGHYSVATKEAIRAELGPAALASVTLDRLQLVAGGARPEDWNTLVSFPLTQRPEPVGGR